MLITYFDEVKFQSGSQPFYWLGGLIVNAEIVKELESEVDVLAKQCFGSSKLSRDTEFHAAEIFHRKRNFKDWNKIEDRLDVLQRLAEIIGREEGIGRVFARLEPAKMIANDKLDQRAFMFFVERVEGYLRGKDDLGILIGDRESGKVSTVFAEVLSHYREHGTPYTFGKQLERLIDTVHFTESHLSRMLQLADAYVWFLQLCKQNSDAYPAKALVQYVREKTNVLSAHKYKIWPTEQSWSKVPADQQGG
ncbi:MAG: DUF3800 domain-containing protein [Gallionella sp.]|nr:DUF3800 domain-containing protein [Gallionella sp.]